MSNSDGGPAFPSQVDKDHFSPQGMTLRDYFAAHCVSAYVVNYTNDGAAEAAYAQADAMLAERDK